MWSFSNMSRPEWIYRVWKDLIKKEFIPIKILFFLMFGAMMTLFPFLTIMARSLGISERELSVVFAINPIVSLLGPPITGILADRIGNFKILLSVLTAASGAAGLTFLAVPVGRQNITLPDFLPYNLTCAHPDDAQPRLSLQEPYKCDYHPRIDTLNLTLTNCSLCDHYRSELMVDAWWQLDAQVSLDNTSLKVPAWSCSLLPQHQSGEASGWTSKTNTSSKAQECYAQCLALVPRQQVCSNTHTVREFQPVLTYMLFLLMRLINGVTLASSLTLFKGATMAILREHKGDYGLQRLSGSLGAIVLTPLSGFLIDIVSHGTGKQDFRPAFYLYFGLKIVAGLVVLCLSLDFRMPSNKVTKDFKSLLKNAEVLTYLLVMMITGAFFGLLDLFLFWLLQDLGASKVLMGITVTVGTAAGIPILVASKHIISTLGHANTLILGLAFYVVRMIGYSYIQDPWWCLPFEALECFTVSLMDTASVSYGDTLATPSTIATLQGMYGGLHYGIGRALGSLIGGNLIKVVGIRNTFRGAAGVSAVACILYFFINYNCFRKQQQERRQKAISEKTNKATVTEEKKHTEDKITKSTADGNVLKQEHLNSAFNGEPNSIDVESARKPEYVNAAFEKESDSTDVTKSRKTEYLNSACENKSDSTDTENERKTEYVNSAPEKESNSTDTESTRKADYINPAFEKET